MTLKALLSNFTVATLLCDDQESKMRFISRMLMSEQRRDRVIVYIDMDTAFTVFLEDHDFLPYAKALRLFRPEVEELGEVISNVCSLNPPRIDTIIFDSVTSFYNFQGGGGANSSMLNRRLGLYLALLNMAVSTSEGRVLFTSMMRARKRKGEESWYLSYAGGRLLRRRSDLILELKKNKAAAGHLEVLILKCSDSSLNGVSLNLDGEDV